MAEEEGIEEEEEMIIGRQEVIDDLALVFHQAIVEYQKRSNKECSIAEVVHAFYNLVFTWGGACKMKEVREEMARAARDRLGMPIAPFGMG